MQTTKKGKGEQIIKKVASLRFIKFYDTHPVTVIIDSSYPYKVEDPSDSLILPYPIIHTLISFLHLTSITLK